MKYAEVAKDNELIRSLKDGFESFFTTDRHFLPGMDHVDRNMFGSLPLTLYLITKDERYREMGMPYADTNGKYRKMQVQVRSHGQRRDIAGKLVCGLTTCI